MVVAESEATQDVLQGWVEARGWAPAWRIGVAPADLAASSRGQAALAASIAAFAPQILIMTLGAPVSEEFLHRHRSVLPPCWALCFGQAVRVEVGMVRRAPALFGKIGLEWLWRLAQEPRRLWPRYARSALWFPRAVIGDLATRRR